MICIPYVGAATRWRGWRAADAARNGDRIMKFILFKGAEPEPENHRESVHITGREMYSSQPLHAATLS